MNVTLAGSAHAYDPSDDQLSRTSIELAAFDGEVGNGTLVIPDLTSSYNVATGRQALIEEGSTVLSDGFMLDQDRTRGFQPAVAREYNFGLADANALLDGFRVSRRRPAETDVERVLAFAAADLPAADTTWVLSGSTANMPAKRYYGDGGWTAELIPDLVSYTGKTLFLHDKADGSGRCLHYHVLTAGHTCGLAISDVIADSLGSATTFFPQEPQRSRTSIDLRNDIKGVDQAGRTSLASDATSITNHDADGLQHQAHLDVEARSQADLDAQTAAFLASQKDDLDTYTCTIGPLDEDALALIRVGDLITVTSTVMGLTASEKRISHMALTPVIGEGSRAHVTWWYAALEMGAPIRRRARVKARQPPPADELPPFEPEYPSGECPGSGFDYTAGGTYAPLGLVANGHGYSGFSTTFMQYGNTFAMNVDEDPHAGLEGDWGNGGVNLCTYPAGGIDYTSGGIPIFVQCTVIGPGVLTAVLVQNPIGACGASSTMDLVCFATGSGTPDASETGAFGTLSIAVPDNGDCGHHVLISANGSWGLVSVSWAPNPINLPEPGQAVHDPCFIGDGSATSFETAYPYLPGSLGLLVNGLDWIAELTETDPTTGGSDVSYALPLGSTVCPRYKAS